MARFCLSKSSIEIVRKYQQNKGLESPTKALHSLLHEYSSKIEKGPHRATQEQSKKVCKS